MISGGLSRAYSAASLMLNNLPSHRFFTPSENFWGVLDSLVPQGVQLVDAGCGMGFLIGEAEQNGRHLIGIDIGQREGQDSRIKRCNAISYGWNPLVWPMICRPSHDGWAYETMQNARKLGATVIYVGLPSNYKKDFWRVRSTCLGTVGEEGERLYVIRPYQSTR